MCGSAYQPPGQSSGGEEPEDGRVAMWSRLPVCRPPQSRRHRMRGGFPVSVYPSTLRHPCLRAHPALAIKPTFGTGPFP